MNPKLREQCYLPVKALIEPGVARFMYKTLLLKQWRGEYYRDTQAPTAISLSDDASTDALLLELQSRIEAISGCRLVPTFGYARLYFRGDGVVRHHDRGACEVSASIHLGRDGGESSLWFAPDNKIEMEEGDGAVYLGCQIDHWRDRFTGNTLGQIFVHYVVAAGPFAQHYFDGRPERFPPSIRERCARSPVARSPALVPAPPVAASPKNTARLKMAADCLARGNLAAANILCRNVIDGEPANPCAWNTLGGVAAKLRLFDRAAEYFGLAGAESDRQRAIEDAAAERNTARRRDGRFLLIKAWGCGFFSDVSHVLGGLLLAELTERVPVVHWGCKSLFGDGTERDAFTRYFEPVSQTTIHDLVRLGNADFFPSRWHSANLLDDDMSRLSDRLERVDAIYYLDRPESVAVADLYLSIPTIASWIPKDHPLANSSPRELYRHIIKRYLRPVQSILAETDQFFGEHLASSPFVAAHIRGSDKVEEVMSFKTSEQFIEYLTKRFFPFFDSLDPAVRIFLMTDDQRIARQALARYGRRIVMTDSQRTETSRGIHYLQSFTGSRLGVEVLKDALIATRATTFVGGLSNVSVMVSLMKDWAPGACNLIGSPTILLRSAFLYPPRGAAELADYLPHEAAELANQDWAEAGQEIDGRPERFPPSIRERAGGS